MEIGSIVALRGPLQIKQIRRYTVCSTQSTTTFLVEHATVALALGLAGIVPPHVAVTVPQTEPSQRTLSEFALVMRGTYLLLSGH